MTDLRGWLWSLRFMVRMKLRSRRTGIPYRTLLDQQLALMRKETEALSLQTDHLRMANELREIEREQMLR